ncbi:hypothetical protein CRE_13000 [Caenorhabditis remanei]|uniref:Uncharacterized protein n=1 Tax=Caenorhabditis remanei TaxID=31234 RepID=E3N167_CAERE|nr:hypothetical protein CRE_13000 [Caenorhabditis remanei]
MVAEGPIGLAYILQGFAGKSMGILIISGCALMNVLLIVAAVTVVGVNLPSWINGSNISHLICATPRGFLSEPVSSS